MRFSFLTRAFITELSKKIRLDRRRWETDHILAYTFLFRLHLLFKHSMLVSFVVLGPSHGPEGRVVPPAAQALLLWGFWTAGGGRSSRHSVSAVGRRGDP